LIEYHKAAAIGPAQEIGAEIEAELPPLLEQGVSRASPKLEIAERGEHFPPEQPQHRLRRQSGAVSKKGESRWYGPGAQLTS
jgi:hypothetical protein